MINKLIIILIIVNVSMANIVPDYENCKWIYRCCEKIRETCVKICEPEIVCPVEEPANINTIESIDPTNIIILDCKAGFRNTNGKCRRVLRDKIG